MAENRSDGALAESSDSELLSLLRGGDTDAYTELWRRYIRAALRLAHRLAPGHADDLASESFLAVYRQITVSGNGPETSFRAYLFTTMRNTAVSWHRQARLTETDPDLDEIEPNDALSTLEDRARSAEVLDAFQALPTRWQRVLWLTEVEEAKRGEIAAEFGIKPNAVSALYRRARAGLRLEWLTLQVPVELRESREHVAGILPALMLDGGSVTQRREIAEHLRRCETCAEIHDELRSFSARMSRSTLAVAGFAGLGIVLPAASQLPFAAIGVGTATAVLTAGGAGAVAAIAAAIGVLAAGGALVTAVLLGAPPGDGTAQAGASDQATAAQSGESRDGSGGAQAADSSGDAGSETRTANGRGNTEPTVPTVVFGPGGAPTSFYEPPARPRPAAPGSIPEPSQAPSAELQPGVRPLTANSFYVAPVLTGRATPGASVAVELARLPDGTIAAPAALQYEAAVAGDGEWAFDLRPLLDTREGTYEYRVWAYTASGSSSPQTGRIAIAPLGLSGFEAIAPFEPFPLVEASSSGIVFQAVGAPHGTICLTSVWTGQSAEIPLDGAGVAVQRIRFLAAGNYYLEFRACEGDYRGPATTVVFDVTEPDGPVFTPFGPDPASTSFELSSP